MADTAIPLDAALTLRMFRSLTLLTISATIKDLAFAKAVEASARSELGRQLGDLARVGGGNSAAYTPDPDGPICPPWWPWPCPWPPRRLDEVFTLPDERVIPKAGLAAIDMFQTLALYNLGFQYGAGGLGREMQKLAIEELGAQFASLQQGGSLAGYDEGDGICPDWWRFQWPRPHGPVVSPAPDQALVLVGLLRSLIHHNIALRFSDTASRARSTDLARKHVLAQAQALGGMQGASTSTAAAWEPGDDICPPWWPWPWPQPHRLTDILDPAKLGAPDPEPNKSLLTTIEIFRSSTVFAIAAQIDNQALAFDLQRKAVGQIMAQAGQL
jgi:hypothetical protein